MQCRPQPVAAGWRQKLLSLHRSASLAKGTQPQATMKILARAIHLLLSPGARPAPLHTAAAGAPRLPPVLQGCLCRCRRRCRPLGLLKACASTCGRDGSAFVMQSNITATPTHPMKIRTGAARKHKSGAGRPAAQPQPHAPHLNWLSFSTKVPLWFVRRLSTCWQCRHSNMDTASCAGLQNALARNCYVLC